MRNVISSIFLVLSCVVCQAQSAAPNADLVEKKKVAQEIMALAGSPADSVKVVEGIISTMRTTVAQGISKRNPQLNEQQTKRATDLQLEVMDKSVRRFTLELLPKMLDEMASAYAEKFSLPELNAIYTYQNSELGRKVQQFTIQEIPELMKPMMAVSQQIGKEAGESFVRIQQQLAQEGIVLK